jgi:putative phosphoribosyl transferase
MNDSAALPTASANLLPFADRAAAGKALASVLKARISEAVVVLALPRGGVPVAEEVARTLSAPLGLVLVRKIGAPGQPELAVAAVAALPKSHPASADTLSHWEQVVDEQTLAACGADHAYVNRAVPEARREIERRAQRYAVAGSPALCGRTVVLVDDGIATGTTVRAAVASVRHAGAARIVLAVPVAPPDALAVLRGDVDDIVCLQQPQPFHAVGAQYREFRQVDDETVERLLAQSAMALGAMRGESALAAQQGRHLALGADAG